MTPADDPTMRDEVRRVRVVLEDAFDRQLDATPEKREAVLLDTLQAELAGVPVPLRQAVIEGLMDLYPDDARPAAPEAPEAAAEIQALRDEIERLRSGADDRTMVGGPPPTASGAPPSGEIAVALTGSPASLADERDVDPANAARIVKALREFAARIGRTYLGATATDDRTMAGRVEQLIRDELEGRAAAGTVGTMLDTVAEQVTGQLVAFHEACTRGASQLLREIAPAGIEAEVARKSGKGLGWLFSQKECWELLTRRYDDLKGRESSLYEDYFDRPFRAALARLAPPEERRR